MHNNSTHSSSNILDNLDPKIFFNAFNSLSQGVSFTDTEGNFVYVNDALLKIYGYTREELIGANCSILRSKRNNSKLITEIHPAALKGMWTGEIITVKKEGAEIIVRLEVTAVENGSGGPILVWVTKDLTEEIKAIDAIEEARGKYTSLFKELKDAVYESTPDGRMVELNPSGMQLFGFNSTEEMMNANIAEELYANSEDRKRFMELLERDGYVKNFEVEIKRKYGVNAIVLETSMAVKDKHGNIKAYRGILHDITDGKRQELQLRGFVEKLASLNEQLRESETELKKLNASKDKFFSIIAHDLRSPFSALLGFSEFLQTDINDLSNEEISTFAGKINESAHTVFSLLENLLQWSRIQTGRMKFEPVMFNISKRVNTTLQLLLDNANNKNIQLLSEVDPEAVVYADENMVNSVIQNLTSNAIKFTKAGGVIAVYSNETDEFIEISVADNGIGMSPDDVAKLFRIDVHHTTIGTNDERGTGLGLVLCNELIVKNGGTMKVDSRLGEGSTFYFTLRKFPQK